MALRLKTKFTLFTSLLVLAIITVLTGVYVSRLTHQVISEAHRDAQRIAQQIFFLSQNAYRTAGDAGLSPASDSPEDVRLFVKQALDQNAGLTSYVDAVIAYSPAIYEVDIVDQYSIALISSDTSLVGRSVPRRPRLEPVLLSGVIEQLRILRGAQRLYEVALPFDLGGKPFGEVRIVVSTSFWGNQIWPVLQQIFLLAGASVILGTLLAGVISYVSLAPLGRISVQVERLSKGQFETAKPFRGRDELGQLSTKIDQIGRQLRGVREIFGSPREDPAQTIAALEDGQLLFSSEGWAVLISPGVEKFLGARPRDLLGKRVHEIFANGSSLAFALRIVGDALSPVEKVEVRLDGPGSVRRAEASVQMVSAGGANIGALVTLRDLDSRERIGSQLQRSESLDVLERILAGVAHEVRQPLNSMSIWVQILKENMDKSTVSPPFASDGEKEPGHVPREEPIAEDDSKKALQVLDNEIHRLNRAVTIFLDFTRRVEPALERTNLEDLVREVLALARPQIEGAGIDLVADLSGGVNSIHVDRELIKQAVLNLVMNAIEAMSDTVVPPLGEAPGPKRLIVSVKQKGENAEVEITDTGRGILPQDRHNIFQLFFTKRPGGSGIGLATAFRIVQLHHGSIDFESEARRGTTFRIELPLARAETKELAAR